MISVIDYGVANLGSIKNMLGRIGVEAILASSPGQVVDSDKIILPGVGSFQHGMAELNKRGLIEPLRQQAKEGVPILGICLGMQLLGNGSDEGPGKEGLGLIDARCERLSPPAGSGLKVPHMGWCQLAIRRDAPIFDSLPPESRYYFVHSFHLVCNKQDDVLATAEYGQQFTAAVQSGTVLGVQFHPEKSHRFGMALLRNFANQ